MNTPLFLTRKREPAVPALPPEENGNRPKAVIDFLTATDQMREECAWLRSENETLIRENKLLHERVAMRESELTSIRAEYIFIQRHDGDMMNSLESIETLIIAARAKARASTYAPPGSGQQEQKGLTERDEQQLANIVSTIRPGQTDAQGSGVA